MAYLLTRNRCCEYSDYLTRSEQEKQQEESIMKKKALALACAMVMAMSLCVTGFAQEATNEISSETVSSESSETSTGDLVAAEQETESNGDQRNDNLPLFIIAGCAVTGFVVVAVVCKKKGRNR